MLRPFSRTLRGSRASCVVPAHPATVLAHLAGFPRTVRDTRKPRKVRDHPAPPTHGFRTRPARAHTHGLRDPHTGSATPHTAPGPRTRVRTRVPHLEP